MNKEENIIKRFVGYNPPKNTVGLSVFNPIGYQKAMDYKKAKKEISNFENRLAELNRLQKKAISIM